MKRLIVLTILVLLGKCETWHWNCVDAAQQQYNACVLAGGNNNQCMLQYQWFYNSCMEGTGCPFNPI